MCVSPDWVISGHLNSREVLNMAGAYTLKTLPYKSMKSRRAPAGVDLTGQAQEAGELWGKTPVPGLCS